jgi:hypothetical protein
MATEALRALTFTTRESVVEDVDPTEAARKQFLDAIQTQRTMFADPDYTEERIRYVRQEDGTSKKETYQHRPRSWVTQVGNKYFVVPKFGAKKLPISEKGDAIQCDDEKAVNKTLDVLEKATNNGELDKLLTEMFLARKRK